MPQGAIIETEPQFTLGGADGTLKLLLHRPDFTTSSSAAEAINKAMGAQIASSIDPSAISIAVPDAYKGRLVELISRVEVVDITVDIPAKVIINERTGTVIIGNNVKLSPVAIAHGNLTVEVKTSFNV